MIRKPLFLTLAPMFAGKTTALLAKADRLRYEGVTVKVFRPATDTRTAPDRVVNHSGAALSAVTVQSAKEIWDYVDEPHETALLLDEVQFFEEDLLVTLAAWTRGGIHSVHLYGLNLDARGRTWPTVQAVLPYATSITLLNAVCHSCREPAHRTQRLTAWPGIGTVAVGAGHDYAPACIRCWSAASLDGHDKSPQCP